MLLFFTQLAYSHHIAVLIVFKAVKLQVASFRIKKYPLSCIKAVVAQ